MTLQQKRWSGVLLWITSVIFALPCFATTWYVRPDGGTRYSTNKTKGQCDGLGDSAYPGSGVNQHCAFNDVRFFFQDGAYVGPFPAYGWIGKGGDTYLIRGTIAQGISYRIGWATDGSRPVCDPQSQIGPHNLPFDGCLGVPGDRYGSGIIPPPSGTAAQPTRILGENYGHCHEQTARTQLHGGYATQTVLNLSGSSYVDVQCLDITDFSQCFPCSNSNTPVDDFANVGIALSNTATHDTLTDLRLHGLKSAGMAGPTGDGVELHYVDIVGNGGAGWNADNGTTGVGHLLVQNYSIKWNGCVEEYPIVHKFPYSNCTDQNSGGYGDGFGTATIDSPAPGWQVTFDQGEVAYNTQDGLDALHLTGPGSSMTVRNTLAYGNMGQQLKIGGSAGAATKNVIYANCNAMKQAIPGTPEGFNKHLSDFCRASDTGVLLTVADNATAIFSDNVIYSAGATGLEVELGGPCETNTCLIRQQRNIFVGFRHNAANGYEGGEGDYANPLYVDQAAKVYKRAGSNFDHNVTFHAKSTWKCPDASLHEKDAYCGDPHLKDESWHLYGYGDTSLTQPIPQGKASTSTDPSSDDAPEETKHHHRVLPVLLGVGAGAAIVAGVTQLRRKRSNV